MLLEVQSQLIFAPGDNTNTVHEHLLRNTVHKHLRHSCTIKAVLPHTLLTLMIKSPEALNKIEI